MFADISPSQLASIWAAPSAAARVALTAAVLGAKHYESNPRSAILVDFAYHNLLFCEEEAFLAAQTSAFFSIMNRVFLAAVDGRAPQRDALQLFKRLVLLHAVADDGGGAGGGPKRRRTSAALRTTQC